MVDAEVEAEVDRRVDQGEEVLGERDIGSVNMVRDSLS